MNEKEALIRIKTGNFNGGYGFDMQLLVDTVGIIGEMFRNGQISEVVRCKDCKHRPTYPEAYGAEINRKWCYWCELHRAWKHDDWFCADGER
jgi:hypothetical protein